jgi:hypothetical protein
MTCIPSLKPDLQRRPETYWNTLPAWLIERNFSIDLFDTSL